MPPFAGFRSLQDYLDQRLTRASLNQNTFSEALGLRRNYIHSVYHGVFTPSKARCKIIAEFFGDDPHLVRVLAGLESPPPDPDDRDLRQLYDIAVSLTPAQRKEAVRLLRQLAKGVE